VVASFGRHPGRGGNSRLVGKAGVWAVARLLIRVLVGLALTLAVLAALFLPPPAWGGEVVVVARPEGARLFESHCAGCHIGGGNILRRGKTLRLAALHRNGINGPAEIAAIAAGGIGQMSGYASVLGEDGPAEVADWVWRQALEDWPRS
jgi:cytochrome c6